MSRWKRSRFPPEAVLVGVEGLAFGRVRFDAKLPHGKSTRNIRLDIDASVISRLADCIRGCPQVYEEARTGAKPATLEEARDPRFQPTWIGHAVWHLQHPEQLMPCLSHEQQRNIIDVPGIIEASAVKP